MKHTRSFSQMTGLGLAALMAVSCAAVQVPAATHTAVPPTATSAPPTAAPTASPVPPTPTSAPAATPGSSAEGNALNIEITSGIAYAKVSIVSSVLDVYVPGEAGPWPVVVVAHGVMESRTNYANLAESIASQGAVVYNIDWWSTPPWNTGIECIACAVRFARATAADYGGDPTRITLVGSSAGAATGAVVALAGDDFGGNCVATDASALPNALVAWEGPYDFATTVYNVYDHPSLKDTDPELWKAINPYSHIGQNPELQVRLVYGNDVDTSWWDLAPQVSIDFHQALADAGYDVELVVVEGADHTDLTTSTSDALAVLVEQVMEVARSASAARQPATATSPTTADRTPLPPPSTPEFPTGRFFHQHTGLLAGTYCVLQFNGDGTFVYFYLTSSVEVENISSLLTGTYQIDGNLYTETSVTLTRENSGFSDCPGPATYAWTFDGQTLEFQVVGEDPCPERLRTYESPLKYTRAE